MQLVNVTEPSIIKKYIALLYAELFDEKAVPTEESFNNIISQLADRGAHHEAYCLIEADEVLAFFTLNESFAIFANGKYGIINELWVNTAFRSQGIGKQVIQEIRRIAAVRNWQRVDVSAPVSEKWDRTFNFYQDNGFIFTGRKLKITI